MNLKKDLILIGCGIHAKNTYLEFLGKFVWDSILIVDIKNNEQKVHSYVKELSLEKIKYYFVNPETSAQKLDINDEQWLNDYLEKNSVDGVIISTEPMYHKMYLDWAIKHSLDIICEKPLSSYKDLNTSTILSKKIYEDAREVYTFSTENKSEVTIQCQRRYHPAYSFIYKYLKEFIIKHQIPISFIEITSSNGIYNLPHEYLNKENHPYKYGYGKLMHSGYHFVDLFCWLSQLNLLIDDNIYKKVECFTSIYTVSDLLRQIPTQRVNYFFETLEYNHNINSQNIPNFLGEVDLHSLIQLKNKANNILTGKLSILQNTVSKRSKLNLSEDMHKKESAIRKERVTIEVGPFLSIQVYAYQNHEIKRTNFSNDYFFEVVIHRNTGIVGGKPLEVIKFDHSTNNGQNSSYNQKARFECFQDFLNNKNNISDIKSHLFTNEVMSIILQNIVNINLDKTPLYRAKIKSLYD